MANPERITLLRPVMPAQPSNEDHSRSQVILERAAKDEITLYFEIPPDLTAIRGWFRTLATSFSDRGHLSSMRMPADYSNTERARLAGNPFINYPERRPDARYVGLTRDSAKLLRMAGQASVHWFRNTLEIVTDDGAAGSILEVWHPTDFVCLRPSSHTNPRGPIIEAAHEYTFRLTLTDLLMAPEPALQPPMPIASPEDVLALLERAPGVAILHDAARAAYRAAGPSRAATMDRRAAESWIAREGDSKLFNKTVLPLAWKGINTQVNRKQGLKPNEQDRLAARGGLEIPFVRQHLSQPYISDSLAIATYVALRHSYRRSKGHLNLKEQVERDLCDYGFAGKGERAALERIITWRKVGQERVADPPLPQDFIYD